MFGFALFLFLPMFLLADLIPEMRKDKFYRHRDQRHNYRHAQHLENGNSCRIITHIRSNQRKLGGTAGSHAKNRASKIQIGGHTQQPTAEDVIADHDCNHQYCGKRRFFKGNQITAPHSGS